MRLVQFSPALGGAVFFWLKVFFGVGSSRTCTRGQGQRQRRSGERKRRIEKEKRVWEIVVGVEEGGKVKSEDEWLTDGCSCILFMRAHFSFRENDLYFRSKILYLFLKEVKKHISGNDAMPASKQRAHVPSDQTPRENAPSFFSKLSCRMKGDKEQEKNVM